MSGRIINGDALEEMREMPSASFGAIITSPPYNMGGVTKVPPRRGPKGGAWQGGRVAYDGHDDAMPHADYVKWQVACLKEMWRLIRPDGCVYYNHRYSLSGSRPIDLHRWVHDAVPVRQIVIWDRGKTINQHKYFYAPTYENIYIIAGPEWRRRVRGAPGPHGRTMAPLITTTDIWRIGPVTDNYGTANRGGHPAVFPVKLPRMCLETMAGDPSPVLDPFLGSGTTAVAASQLGLDWVGIEQSKKYCDWAKRRVEIEGCAGQRRIL